MLEKASVGTFHPLSISYSPAAPVTAGLNNPPLGMTVVVPKSGSGLLSVNEPVIADV
jgi:hypothetical protein